jgi:hypothetical protein
MTKRVLLLLVFGTTTAWAQPKISFPGSPWDFGEMLQQQKASHQFELRNEGGDTLFISRIKPSCGCTSAPLTRDVVGPGESIWIDITFDSKKFSGQVAKRVLVFSNDPVDPQATIEFTAQVETSRKLLAVVNEPTDLGQLLPNEPDQSEIVLTNIGDEPYRLSIADWPQSWLQPEWTERVIDPGDTLTMAIGTRSVPPLGRFTTSITFDIQGTTKSRMSLPLTGVGLVD